MGTVEYRSSRDAEWGVLLLALGEQHQIPISVDMIIRDNFCEVLLEWLTWFMTVENV